jgi:hypothetical protein
VIKVVVDTNVFVSSFYGGNPRKIVDLWKSGLVTFCLSKPVVEEYVEVLNRLGLEKDREFGELLRHFAHGFHVLFNAKTPALHVVKEDPEDDKFIECAVALKADFVISGERNLTAIEDYMGVKILTSKQFLDRYPTLEA